eukprot:365478-Chlamydomonas_euryale.AAC.9
MSTKRLHRHRPSSNRQGRSWQTAWTSDWLKHPGARSAMAMSCTMGARSAAAWASEGIGAPFASSNWTKWTRDGCSERSARSSAVSPAMFFAPTCASAPCRSCHSMQSAWPCLAASISAVAPLSSAAAAPSAESGSSSRSASRKPWTLQTACDSATAPPLCGIITAHERQGAPLPWDGAPLNRSLAPKRQAGTSATCAKSATMGASNADL